MLLYLRHEKYGHPDVMYVSPFRRALKIDVEYIGLEAKGIEIVGRFIGTVVRDDYDQPPPDVRAIVRASNDESGEEVVARCNWRPPYVRPSAP